MELTDRHRRQKMAQRNSSKKTWGGGNAVKSRSSLKNQLRGHERLLEKVEDEERKKDLREKIALLRQQIGERRTNDRTRENASKSHGARFLERQKLVRMERQARKKRKGATTKHETDAADQELLRIALDEVYVAHYPLDVKYHPLFQKGHRIVDNGRTIVWRAITRKRALQNMQTRVKWISEDQYERLPSEWSVDMEKDVFGTKKKQKKKEPQLEDSRFAISTGQEKIVEAVNQIECTLNEEEEKEEQEQEQVKRDDSRTSAVQRKETTTDSSDDDDDESSDSDDEADPMAAAASKPRATPGEARLDRIGHDDESSESSDSSSESSSDDSDDDDDDSDSELDDNDDKMDEKGKGEEERVVTAQEGTQEKDDDNDGDSFDDFLMPRSSGDQSAFAKAKQDRADRDFGKGDKSKGWATQRQRPGEWKKKRKRR